MVSETPFLKLRKTASTELMDIKRDFNDNLQILDQRLGKAFDQPWQEFRNPMVNVGVRIFRCRYKIYNNIFFYQGNFKISAVPTGTIYIHLPPGIVLNTFYPFNISGSGPVLGVTLRGGVVVGHSKHFLAIGGSQTGGAYWNATTPLVWATDNHIGFHIRGEIEAT